MKTIKKKGLMNSDVRLFLSNKISPPKKTIQRLVEMSKAKGVVEAVAGMPDLHYKYGRPVPTGVVVPTKNEVIPDFLVASCGIGFIKTNIKNKSVDKEVLDNIFLDLMKEISADRRNKPYISEKDFDYIVLNGADWLVNKGFDKRNLENIELGGNAFKHYGIDAKNFAKKIPRISKKLATVSMAVMGLGNHFIEMQNAEKILNKKISNSFEINKDDVGLMIHSSPDAFGKSMHDHFSFRSNKLQKLSQQYRRLYDWFSISRNKSLQKTAQNFNYYANKIYRYANWKFGALNKYDGRNYKTLSMDSKFGKNFMMASYAEINFGFVNRMMQVFLIQKVLERHFDNVKISLLYDGNHDAFQKEVMDGEEFWMHRNGSCRAYPKHLLKNHRLFKKTGQPMTMPGSMGTSSYLMAPLKGNRKSFYSASHGAGRILDKPETLGKFKKEDIKEEMKNKKIRLYRFGQGNIVEESPSSYKDINEVIKVLQDNNLANPIVKLKPLAVLKGN